MARTTAASSCSEDLGEPSDDREREQTGGPASLDHAYNPPRYRVVLPVSNQFNLRTVLRFSIRTLLISTAAAALLSLSIARLFVWPEVQAELFIRNHPVQTHVEVHDSTTMASDRITYSIGNYGVTEFGNIRLAIRGCTFGGESSGRICLANNLKFSGGGGSTGVGNRRFTTKGIPGGTRCTFGGLTFNVEYGILSLLNQQFRIDAKDQVIVIDQFGKIEATATIGP